MSIRSAILLLILLPIWIISFGGCTPDRPKTVADPGPANSRAKNALPDPFDFEEPEITVAAVGDMMFARRVAIHMDSTGYDAPLGELSEQLAAFDITTGNLECPVGRIGSPMDKKYVFRADPAIIPQLAESGFDVLCVANNHAFDYGLPCFLGGLDLLRFGGIEPVGGGRNLAHALTPVYLERGGKIFGFLAFNDTGTNFIGSSNPACAPAYDEWVFEAAESAAENCDVLIVHLHWGREYLPYPTERQTTLGRALIDRGADVVLGHHPHRWEGIEFYAGGLIAYSLGNFVFDQNDLANNLSGVLELTFRGSELATVSVRPVEMLTSPRETHPASPPEFGIFEGILRESCADFPTAITRDRDRLILNNTP